MQNKTKKHYTFRDLINHSSNQIYSSFGDIKLSGRTTAPRYSFAENTTGLSHSQYIDAPLQILNPENKFIHQGPKYEVTDKFNYVSSPKWKFNTVDCSTLLPTKAKYDHYQRLDIDMDVNKADKNRKQKLPSIRFGGESRFPRERINKLTPGFQYDPINLSSPTSPSYSIYNRRPVKGYDYTIIPISSPRIVGPGSYDPELAQNTSDKINQPLWTIPKDPRVRKEKRTSFHQTYDNTSSIGKQIRSLKQSSPGYSSPKSNRETPRAVLKCHMQYKPTPVKISIPKF